MRRRLTWIVLAAGMVLVVVGALVFEPWKLFVDQRVEEASPAAAAAPVGGAPADQVVLARGQLISHEHESSGSVVVYRLDEHPVLRVEGLRTSNGPALHVWLADALVVKGSAGWGVFDDGRYVDLGELKGNIGSSNYLIPPEVDLGALPSMSIWCARFHVSFAAAHLSPPQ